MPVERFRRFKTQQCSYFSYNFEVFKYSKSGPTQKTEQRATRSSKIHPDWVHWEVSSLVAISAARAKSSVRRIFPYGVSESLHSSGLWKSSHAFGRRKGGKTGGGVAE